MMRRSNAMLDRLRDGLPDVLRAGLAAQVARARPALQHGLDRAHHGVARVLVTEVLEHHGTRPNLADRVRDLLPVDVRGAPVDGLEARRELALGVEVRRW